MSGLSPNNAPSSIFRASSCLCPPVVGKGYVAKGGKRRRIPQELGLEMRERELDRMEGRDMVRQIANLSFVRAKSAGIRSKVEED